MSCTQNRQKPHGYKSTRLPWWHKGLPLIYYNATWYKFQYFVKSSTITLTFCAAINKEKVSEINDFRDFWSEWLESNQPDLGPKCRSQYFYFDLHALYHILLFLVAFCSLSSVGISSVFLLVMVKIVVKNAGSPLPNTASREMLFLAAIGQETKRISNSSSVNMPSDNIPDWPFIISWYYIHWYWMIRWTPYIFSLDISKNHLWCKCSHWVQCPIVLLAGQSARYRLMPISCAFSFIGLW